MLIPIVELQSMPQDELRALNMPEVVRRIARIANPTIIELRSEVLDNGIRVTAVTRADQFLDLQTGKIL